MAYVDTIIANMGVMVGTPTLATTIDPADLRDTKNARGLDYDEAVRQAREFARGNIRLPGTRGLDPIVVLEVRDKSGRVVYTQGPPERRQVVDAGSVWLLHTIMSDCTARVIIWQCGKSNDDNQLDFFLDGRQVPGGVKTGTQQGAKITDTLETWMTGYTRYAGTAVWVGNATNELVRDGSTGNFASANTTIGLFKNWMAEYHRALKERGVFATPEGFDSLQPRNVAMRAFKTPSTSRLPGGCNQIVQAWQRTDVMYADECLGGYRTLPSFKPESAIALARAFGIPLPPSVGGFAAASPVTSPSPISAGSPSPTASESPSPTASESPSPVASATPLPPRSPSPSPALTPTSGAGTQQPPTATPAGRGTPPPPPTPTQPGAATAAPTRAATTGGGPVPSPTAH
jgi:membrane peptidoglycan carboxypeptidase